MAEPTGDVWPIHGIRLSPLYPCKSNQVDLRRVVFDRYNLGFSSDIEAEVRYAVRNEYAETAVDFIARRSRLAFLNTQASLDALPRVVDIMAEELGWNTARRRTELKRGVEFLQTMGLLGSVDLEPTPKSWAEKARARLFGSRAKSEGRLYIANRALFEPGEVDSLKNSFLSKIGKAKEGTGETEGQPRLKNEDVLALLRETPSYEKVRNGDFAYVLVEAGFSQQRDLDFDEFVEVSSSTRVNLSPSSEYCSITSRIWGFLSSCSVHPASACDAHSIVFRLWLS